MKSCIIFACTIVSKERLFVLERFLETFQQHFSNCDLFIGINPVSVPETESVINSYHNLNVVSMSRCSLDLYCESDASAYQEALRNLVISEHVYENYWFIHTKSGVNQHSDYLREWYIDNFLSKRIDIEEFIKKTDDIGSYGLLGLEFDESRNYIETDCEIDLFKNTINKQFTFTHANFFYIHTLYVINKKPMKIFLDSITNTWFSTKLDRYYFEGVFPFIVSRTGYFPYLENRYSCTGKDLEPYIQKWIDTNYLEKYNKYSNIYKTNFLFHQLNPPYVNSNS